MAESIREHLMEAWNNSIEDFQLQAEFLRNPTPEFLIAALTSLVRHMSVDVDCIVEGDGPPSALNTGIYRIHGLLNFCSFIYLKTSSSRVPIVLYDIIRPTPKRTIRILSEFHNFALFYKQQDKYMEDIINEFQEQKRQLLFQQNAILQERNNRANEILTLNNKLKKHKSLPELISREQAEQIIIEKDIETLDTKLRETKATLATFSQLIEKHKTEISRTKALLVENPEELMCSKETMSVKLQDSIQQRIDTEQNFRLKKSTLNHLIGMERLIESVNVNIEQIVLEADDVYQYDISMKETDKTIFELKIQVDKKMVEVEEGKYKHQIRLKENIELQNVNESELAITNLKIEEVKRILTDLKLKLKEYLNRNDEIQSQTCEQEIILSNYMEIKIKLCQHMTDFNNAMVVKMNKCNVQKQSASSEYKIFSVI